MIIGSDRGHRNKKFVLLIAVVLYGGPEGSHMQIKNCTCKLKILPAN